MSRTHCGTYRTGRHLGARCGALERAVKEWMASLRVRKGMWRKVRTRTRGAALVGPALNGRPNRRAELSDGRQPRSSHCYGRMSLPEGLLMKVVDRLTS